MHGLLDDQHFAISVLHYSGPGTEAQVTPPPARNTLMGLLDKGLYVAYTAVHKTSENGTHNNNCHTVG